MIVSNLKPIPNEPVLFIKNKEILVLGDLHIGIENELIELGLNVNLEDSAMLDKLKKICDKYKPKITILLGDIKHNIPISTRFERKKLKLFFNAILKYGKIHLIPGNHDGNIKWFITDEIEVHKSNGFIIENIGFVHGHRWPSEDLFKCDQIIMGHTHPTVMLADRLGYKTYEACWVKAKFKKKETKKKFPDSKNPEVLILPAFNPLCGGIAVNKEGIVGPLGKLIDIKNAEVYLLDGTSLGKVKNI